MLICIRMIFCVLGWFAIQLWHWAKSCSESISEIERRLSKRQSLYIEWNLIYEKNGVVAEQHRAKQSKWKTKCQWLEVQTRTLYHVIYTTWTSAVKTSLNVLCYNLIGVVPISPLFCEYSGVVWAILGICSLSQRKTILYILNCMAECKN